MTPQRKFSGFFVMYTWNAQSQNAILNSWGKPGQKKKKILFWISTEKDSGGSRSQK